MKNPTKEQLKKWRKTYYQKNKDKYKLPKDVMTARNKANYRKNRIADLLRHSTKRYVVDADVTEAWIKELIVKQNNKCAISGITFSDDVIVGGKSIYNYSIDRIDSNKHYSRDNIQMVCVCVNVAKNALPQNIFVDMCRQVAKNG